MDLHYRKQDALPHLELEGSLSYFRTSQEVEGNLVLYPPGSTGLSLMQMADPFCQMSRADLRFLSMALWVIPRSLKSIAF